MGNMESMTRQISPGVLVKAIALLGLTFCNFALAALPPECGTLDNHFGPFDYRDPGRAGELKVVEEAHFDGNVAQLRRHSKCQRKRTCSGVHSDMAYTLRVFPNHHNALLSMSRYHLLGKDRTDRPMQYSAECWFRRAIEFQPQDPTVRMIHAHHLSKVGNMSGARSEYEEALLLAPDSAEVNYNAGLFYLDINELDKAADCATRAYALGHPLPGLRNRLSGKGIDIDMAPAQP